MITSDSPMQFLKKIIAVGPLFCKVQHDFNNLLWEKIFTLKLSDTEI